MTNSVENIKNRLRKNIKKYRKEANLSQTELSVQADLSINYIYQIERGLRVPSIKRLIMIADVLNKDISKLFEI